MPARTTRPESKAGSPKQLRLEARLSAPQKRLLCQAAEIQGRSVSEFVLQAAQEAAQRVVDDYYILRLNERDSRMLVQALLHPAAPPEKLREGARRFKEQQGL